MTEHANEEAATEPAAASAAVVASATGSLDWFTQPGAYTPARVLSLQRAIGNTATGRLLQRAPTPAATATTKTATAPKPTSAATATPDATPDFTPFVPTADVQRCFQAGVDVIKALRLRLDHIVVISGAVYVATPDGRASGNFARKGAFGLPPGVYIMDGSGTAQYGYRKGATAGSWRGPIGWRNENLPEDIRKLSDEREKALKAQGKKGPTIFLHDFVDITEQQEEKDFGAIILFVTEPAKQDPGADQGKPGAGAGADKPADKPKEGDPKLPALAQPGYGVDFGHEGGKRADLPPFPARIRPMSSMRGGVMARGEGDERAGLPFIYQPVRGAAVYQMLIDYTSAAPGQLLFQAAAAGVLHAYRWELWDITESHDKALTDAADEAARSRPGKGSRTIGSTDAARQRLGVATDELNERPQQYDEDQRRAIAEGRYFDALGSQVNKELFGLEVGFRYGKELLGLAGDAMDIGRERDVPIPKEGVYVLRCIARYDPYAERDGRPTRAPSVASIVIKVKPRDWLSRDALTEEEASLAELELNVAIIKARLKQAKEAGADTKDLEAQLADAELKVTKARGKVSDTPVALLEKELAQRIKDLKDAQTASSLYQAGYGDYDTNLRQLTQDKKALEEQLAHAKKQLGELQAANPKGVIHRLRATLVSKVTGQTYPLLLHCSDPKEESPGSWTCRLADATSKSGKYYSGRGASAILALQNAIDALAGDDLDGFGEGSLAVRAPAAGAWKDLDEAARTYTKDTKYRDWTAARARLDELATVLGILALFAVPGAGEVAMALGATLAAARIIERYRNDTLHWDPELISDIIAIASAAAAGAAAVGKLRIIKANGKWVIVPAEESSRIAKLAKVAQRTNDWFLDPANIAWGNIQLLVQLKEISDQELKGGLTATEARRNKAALLASAINTNLALVGKVTGAMHEADQAFEKKPKAKGEAPVEPPRRSAEEHPTSRRGPSGEEPPRPVPDDARPAPVVHEPVPETPKPLDIPPKVLFRAALETGSALPVAEAHAVMLETGDWKGALKKFVGTLPEGVQKRAMEALAEARQQLVRQITDEAAARFGADQRNYGTPGFGSDIDLTITPRERLPGFSGKERPIADQIRAAADAAEFINRRLRERLGGEPDRAIDTNVYSYIAEDRVSLGTPELRARAGALEAEIGLAEARRGVDPATWAALETAIADKLKGSDPITRQALADLQARLQAGVAMEAALRAEMERVQATLREGGVAPDQIPVQARDALLATKKRDLAKLFEAKDPDMIKILRLQAEIRWFAPDAYASGAAFEYTVGFGQARRSAGSDSAQEAGRSTPERADVLKDLADNWARERSRPEQLRQALFAAAATAQLGMLGAHTHGSPPEQVKAAAKYAARILDLLTYAGLGTRAEDPVPKALSEFVRGRWPDADERARISMLADYARAIGMGDQVQLRHGEPTGVSEAVMNRFVTDVKAWALEATARLMVSERTHSEAVPDPSRPAPPSGPGPSGDKPTPGPTGGLRGQTYELTNTYTRRDGTTAGGLERPTGAEKVSKAMAGLRRLDADASVTALVKKGLEFTLSVPDPANPGSSIDVAVTVVIKPTELLTPSEHGEAGGPGRLIPSAAKDESTGARVWKATIEVDSKVQERDLPHVLRHEANELVGLVRAHPGGEPPGGWGVEMRPGVMVRGAAPGALPWGVKSTAHDRAAVLELRALYDALEASKEGSPERQYRERAIERARVEMGLNEAVNLREKLRMLREAGLDFEVERLTDVAAADAGAAHRQAEAAAGRPASIITDALAGHILIPSDAGEFKAKGLHGGHVTAHLMDFCAATPFHMREIANRDAAGTRWHIFEQWRWNGDLAKKPTDASELPGGERFDASKWTLSDQPKTTADDASIYMREADSAWRRWFANHNGVPPAADDFAVTGAGRAFGGPAGKENARSDGGVEFAGFFDPEVGSARVRSIFPDESWLR